MLAGATASPAAAPWVTGDLVFVRPRFDPASPLDNAILDVGAATNRWLAAHGGASSNETAVHVALAVVSGDGGVGFIEAVPPAVRLTPAPRFWAGWPGGTSFYRARPVDERVRRAGARAAEVALAQRGRPYALDFGPPPREFYCSSLVAWAYAQALGPTPGEKPGAPFVDDDFKLLFVPSAFWTRYYAALNVTLPTNQSGTNPTLLLNTRHVHFAPFEPPPPPPPAASARARPPRAAPPSLVT